MIIAQHRMSLRKVMRDTTLAMEIVLTGVRWMKLRMWLGAKLIKLAAVIMGCNIEVKWL